MLVYLTTGRYPVNKKEWCYKEDKQHVAHEKIRRNLLDLRLSSHFRLFQNHVQMGSGRFTLFLVRPWVVSPLFNSTFNLFMALCRRISIFYFTLFVIKSDFCGLQNTDKGSIPGMNIMPMLLIQSEFKIVYPSHKKSPFVFQLHLESATASGPY